MPEPTPVQSEPLSVNLGDFECYRDDIEKAVGLCKIFLDKDNNSIPAHAMLLHKSLKDGHREMTMYAICGDMLQKPSDKNAISGMLIKDLFTKDGEILILIMDSLNATLPKGKRRQDMPDNLMDWPKEFVVDCLTVCVNAVGKKGIAFAYEYCWVNGEVVLGVKHEGYSSGRFIFDLREASLENALKQVMNRKGMRDDPN